MEQGTCQACRREAAERRPEQRYHLCEGCARRFEAGALRPLEWFNLASIHGRMGPLHSNFYDGNGRALEPKEPVVDPDLYPVPTLGQTRGDLERMLDYAIVREAVEEPIVEAFAKIDPTALLAALEVRSERSTSLRVRGVLFQIAARCLGTRAADWVRRHWTRGYHDLTQAFEAARFCLPRAEAFERAVGFLEQANRESHSHHVNHMSILDEPRLVEWIEGRLTDPAESIDGNWGIAAARSGISWKTVRRWIEKGRPLSLAALDALAFFVRLDEHLHRRPQPRLIEPDDVKVMTRVLDEYLRRDPAPRVEERIGLIQKNWDEICRH